MGGYCVVAHLLLIILTRQDRYRAYHPGLYALIRNLMERYVGRSAFIYLFVCLFVCLLSEAKTD